MNVTVTKHPDGVAFMTKDGHGELCHEEVAVGDKFTFGDNLVELVNLADGVVARFSYVDYLDTSNREQPGKGVRHTVERSAPGSFAAGPYTVEVSESAPAKARRKG